jgi:hypothetical protein
LADETRAVEDRLSDALHARLTQRFVDRRTSVLMRRLKQRESLVAHVTDKGEVTIDGEFVGASTGSASGWTAAAGEEAKTLRAAGIAALAPVLSLKADRFYNAPDTEIDVTEQGGLMWGEFAVGKLVPGADRCRRGRSPSSTRTPPPRSARRSRRRLQHWIDRQIAARFEPLIALRDDEALRAWRAGSPSGSSRRSASCRARRSPTRSRARPGEPGEPAQARRPLRPVLRVHAAAAEARADAARLVLWSLVEGSTSFPKRRRRAS